MKIWKRTVSRFVTTTVAATALAGGIIISSPAPAEASMMGWGGSCGYVTERVSLWGPHMYRHSERRYLYTAWGAYNTGCRLTGYKVWNSNPRATGLRWYSSSAWTPAG